MCTAYRYNMCFTCMFSVHIWFRLLLQSSRSALSFVWERHGPFQVVFACSELKTPFFSSFVTMKTTMTTFGVHLISDAEIEIWKFFFCAFVIGCLSSLPAASVLCAYDVRNSVPRTHACSLSVVWFSHWYLCLLFMCRQQINNKIIIFGCKRVPLPNVPRTFRQEIAFNRNWSRTMYPEQK